MTLLSARPVEEDSKLVGQSSPSLADIPSLWTAPSAQEGVAAGGVLPFRERAPWLGGDLQTLRNVLRGAPPDLLGGERLLLPMSEGDRLAGSARSTAGIHDEAARRPRARPHRLRGERLRRREHAAFGGHGWPVLRLNLRGTRPSLPTAAGHYHAGRTEDLAEALRGLPADLTRVGFVLLGHSLGGNLVLKFMGEGGHGLPVLAAIAVSTPIDLAATCARMMTPRNFVYQRYMLKAMKREALTGAAMSTAERSTVAAVRNVYEFDDRFIAPRFGYRDAQDYYESNAAEHFLASITRPTLILHALDDPSNPAVCYTGIDWPALPMIEANLTPRGGHLGFHGQGSRVPWHDRATAWWLARKFRISCDNLE